MGVCLLQVPSNVCCHTWYDNICWLAGIGWQRSRVFIACDLHDARQQWLLRPMVRCSADDFVLTGYGLQMRSTL
jgi:hypothetical protein